MAEAQDGARREEGETTAPVVQPTLTAPPVLLEAATPEYPPEAEKAGQTAAERGTWRKLSGVIVAIAELSVGGNR